MIAEQQRRMEKCLCIMKFTTSSVLFNLFTCQSNKGLSDGLHDIYPGQLIPYSVKGIFDIVIFSPITHDFHFRNYFSFTA